MPHVGWWSVPRGREATGRGRGDVDLLRPDRSHRSSDHPRLAMTVHPLELIVIETRLAVCRLGSEESLPCWAVSGEFFSITRTTDELSVVCPEELVPGGVRAEIDADAFVSID